MRGEIERLLIQSKEDLETARRLIEVERFYASVFFSEQAAEKALKALYMEKFREQIFTHDLVEISEKLGAPDHIIQASMELTPDYLTTRYPNAANAIPAKLYDLESAKKHLEFSEGILEWVDKEIKEIKK
jgi:HEPN domain-containing protein